MLLRTLFVSQDFALFHPLPAASSGISPSLQGITKKSFYHPACPVAKGTQCPFGSSFVLPRSPAFDNVPVSSDLPADCLPSNPILRRQLGQREGTVLGDALSMCLCGWCEICRMAREVHTRSRS
ncbi:hypothetical protein E2320_000240 [Naja naja]|nr:hypothetical protein E2320_000240 [Naja naja]